MPRRKQPLVPGEYYHLYNRGHSRGHAFLERDNYLYFLRQLSKYVAPAQATIVAYVLMPTHYHLLVPVQTDGVSHAMQLLGISYTMSVNVRYDRTGSVFEGAFKAKLIESDEYLTHLSRYIHLNPVRGGLATRAEDWEYSSYRDYVGLRRGRLPQPGIVLAQLGGPEGYRQFVESYQPADSDLVAPYWF